MVVHTGPNIQFGGLKKGLLSSEYQVFIEGVVTIDPKNPALRQIVIEAINFFNFSTILL